MTKFIATILNTIGENSRFIINGILYGSFATLSWFKIKSCYPNLSSEENVKIFSKKLLLSESKYGAYLIDVLKTSDGCLIFRAICPGGSGTEFRYPLTTGSLGTWIFGYKKIDFQNYKTYSALDLGIKIDNNYFIHSRK